MTKAKILIAILVLTIGAHETAAQSCGNCDETPRITEFDFDVRVPQPDTATGTNNLWPEWKNLFIIASAVGTNIKKADGNCIRLMIPPAIDTGDAQIAMIGGQTFSNLPSNPLLDKDLSTYGDYLLTGTITADGLNCRVHAEIQTSCSRKVVVSADVTFSLSSVVGNVNNIAQQIAMQFSPLSQKIKQFELEERKNNPALSLFKFSDGEIKVRPLKRTLKSGESTTITLEVKDCDGVPLAGREIVFTEDSIGGMKISGTIGGKVTPARVVTDANGVAKANFTLKAGAQYAIIAAHSPGLDVKGCNSMLAGDAAINIRYNYSGRVTYTYENTGKCDQTTESNCSKIVSKSEHSELATYKASFYSTTQKYAGSVQLTGVDDDESEGTDIPELLEGGTYENKNSSLNDHVIICESVQKGSHVTSTTRSHTKGELKHGQIQFEIPNKNGGGKITIYLDYNTTQQYIATATLRPTMSGTQIEKHTLTAEFDGDVEKNKGIIYERKITDGKLIFTIKGSRSVTSGCGMTVVESINCVIIQE